MTEKSNGQILYSVEIEGVNDALWISPQDLEELDIAEAGEACYHILQNARGQLMQVVEADYLNKRYVIKSGDQQFVVQLRDAIETRVHSMGLDKAQHAKIDELHAPMPGTTLEVRVSDGDKVEVGDPLLILEAMKMENVIAAPVTAIVAQVCVQQGDSVEKGQLLVKFQ